MGEWLCPRCGGKDVYDGNAVVATKGTTVGREIGNTGTYMAIEVGGGHTTVRVTKCRKCEEILSRANYHLSAAELAQKAKSDEKWADQRDSIIAWIIAVLVGALAMVVGVVIVDIILVPMHFHPSFTDYTIFPTVLCIGWIWSRWANPGRIQAIKNCIRSIIPD